MSDRNDHPINWPASLAIAVGAIAFGVMMWAMSLADSARYKAEVENNKNRIEYDKWLIEKGIIKEPRIR